MSQEYKYFVIPYALVPEVQAQAHTVWYAMWSTTPPTVDPGVSPPMVLVCTQGAVPMPEGSQYVGSGLKDPPVPPPPPPELFDPTWLETYKRSLEVYLAGDRSLSLSADRGMNVSSDRSLSLSRE